MVRRMYSKILLDNPSANPGLRFQSYASALKDIIELSEPQFSVGIFGGWGSGKTTLMRAIENQLNDKIVSVWFNAWRYEKEEHLIIPLLDTLRDALVTWAEAAESNPAIDPTFRDKAIKAASTITKAARAIFAGLGVTAKFPLIEVSLDANKTVSEWRQSNMEADKKDAESPQSAYHASFKALQDSLTEFTQHGEQRVIVFIDDLDRCLPSNALQVLESMKLFFDLEGFVFVVGLDQKVIEASINWNYRFPDSSTPSTAGPPISGADYIKKLFQVPFNLPSVSSSQLDDYLASVFPSAGERDEEQEGLLGLVRPHLDTLVQGSEVNPREVKRYINSYILQKMILPDLDDDVTLILQTIAFRPDWSTAYQVYRSRPDAFAEAAKRQLGGEDSALRNLDTRLDGLPESFFQYIGSKGGHKLLNLDSSQREAQVRTLEVTRDRPDAFESLGDELRAIADYVDTTDAVELSHSPETFERIRNDIREIDRHAQFQIRALSRETGGAGRELTGQLQETISSVKDATDRLGFALRRGNEMDSNDFDDLLRRRSEIVNLLRTSASIFYEVQTRARRNPDLGS